MKNIFWKKHAKERFWERVLKYGFEYSEAEFILRKQRVRISKGFDEKYNTEKFECIEKIHNVFITFQKAENNESIFVITLWESNPEEEKIWRNLQKK